MGDVISWGLINSVKKNVTDVKNDLPIIKTGVSDIQSDMTQLSTDVNDAVDEIQTTINNAPVGGPIPYIIDTGNFKAESVEEGIKLTYTATIHAKADWDQFTARGSVPPYGVMIRYGTDGFPRTPNEGILAVDDTDIVDKTAKGPVAGNGLYGKTKTFTVVGLTNNTLYYFSAFPYSYNKVFNINYGPLGADLSTNNSQRKTCTYTGNKGTLTVTVTQDYDYKTLGEFTATMTPSSGSAKTQTRTGPGQVVFAGLDTGTYTLSFETKQYFTTPESQQIVITAGQPNTTSAEYALSGDPEDYSWQEIKNIAQAGDASGVFSVGATKKVTVKTFSGNLTNASAGDASESVQMDAVIVGIDQNLDVGDKSNPKKNIVFCTKGFPIYGLFEVDNSTTYSEVALVNFLEYADESYIDVFQYITPIYVNISGYHSLNANHKEWNPERPQVKLFVPSGKNVGYQYGTGTKFPYLSSNEKRKLDGDKEWVTSSLYSPNGLFFRDYGRYTYYVRVDTEGELNESMNISSDPYYYRPLCFCIA